MPRRPALPKSVSLSSAKGGRKIKGRNVAAARIQEAAAARVLARAAGGIAESVAVPLPVP